MMEMFMSNCISVLRREEGWITQQSEGILEIRRGHIGYKPRNQFRAKKKRCQELTFPKKVEGPN